MAGFKNTNYLAGAVSHGEVVDFNFEWQGENGLQCFTKNCDCVGNIKLSQEGISGTLTPGFPKKKQDGQRWMKYVQQITVMEDDGEDPYVVEQDGELKQNPKKKRHYVTVEALMDLETIPEEVAA